MKRRSFIRTLTASCTLIGVHSSFLPKSSAVTDSRRLNVLFIPVDDLNHWVSYTGRNKQAKTPNIDRISRMGVSFSNSHCAAPACEPTRASLFFRLRVYTSCCYLNGHLWKKYIPEWISLTATFKKAGYFIAGVGKTYHSSYGGIKSVYASEWDEYPSVEKSASGGAKKYDGYHEPLSVDFKDDDLGDWHLVNYCKEVLQRKHDKPFFLACGFSKPHLPWAVPRKYYKMFPRDEIKLPPHIKGDLDDISKAGLKMIKSDHPKFLKSGRWKDAIQSYLATVAYVDVCIGRLLDALEKSAYRDNTIIVLWGDHGWHLGEKERWRKFALWEEATRSPMIWYAPGVTRKNAICSRPVDFMSIYPTLCDLTGIKIPKHVEGKSIRSLLEDPDSKWDGVAITTHGYMNHAVRSERWRYIQYADGSEELYDHNNDEYEWRNLANLPEYKEVIKKLAMHLPKKNIETKPTAKKEKKKKKKKKK